MKSKRAQTEIIVTVLLVLIALAAIAAVAYFIMGQVRSGTGQAENRADCMKVSLSIDKVTNASKDNILLSRGNDDIAIKEIRAYVNGKAATTTQIPIPDKLATVNGNITVVGVGDKVRLNVVLNSTGYLCDGGVEEIATTA